MSATIWVIWDSTLSTVDISSLSLQSIVKSMFSPLRHLIAKGSIPNLRALSASDSELLFNGAYCEMKYKFRGYYKTLISLS